MGHKTNTRMLLRHIISAPFTYALIFPLIILDLFTEIYHHVCFRLYGIKLLARGDYIRMDRHKLKYLNFIEKLNCAYCSYANGLMGYASAIAAETEKYWCGIKHRKYKGFKEPAHHKHFLEYGDEKSFRKKFYK